MSKQSCNNSIDVVYIRDVRNNKFLLSLFVTKFSLCIVSYNYQNFVIVSYLLVILKYSKLSFIFLNLTNKFSCKTLDYY